MTEKQSAYASGLDEYFWQMLDGDLDIFVCFRESEGESTDTTTDVDNSRIFLEWKL
jgi:hypothetical protein